MRLLTILTVSFVFLSGAACYHSPCDVPSELIPDGPVLERSFSSKEGGFKIGLPPREPVQSEQDDPRSTTFKWLVLNGGSYEVSYFDSGKELEHNGERSKVFDNLRDSLLSKRTGKLEVDKDLLLSGHPGREIKITDDKGIDIRRIYFVGERIYTVAVYVPINLECALDGAVKVLNSFEFINDKSTATISDSFSDVYAAGYRQRC